MLRSGRSRPCTEFASRGSPGIRGGPVRLRGAQKLEETSNRGAYSTLAGAVSKALAASSQPNARMTSAPSVVGNSIVEIAKARRPRTRYRVGFGAGPMLFMRWLLPDRAFDAVIGRAVGI